MWKISSLLLLSILGKVLPGKDRSILCCFVINSGLRIQAQLLHHHDLLTFSKYECFELLWFQEQVEQWLIKSSAFKITNKIKGMLLKARKTAGNIDWKSLQVLGSISSSQCPRKTSNFLITFFLITFFLISQYHQTHCTGGRSSGLLDFYTLSRLCSIRSNIIAQGFMPCGLKMQHTSRSAGAKVEAPVSTMTSGESPEWQEQAELLAHGPPAQWDTRGCLGKLGIFWLWRWIKMWKHWSKPP